MARSSYIYILVDRRSGESIGGFTVKHEMETARKRLGKPTYYMRYRDNQPDVPPDIFD